MPVTVAVALAQARASDLYIHNPNALSLLSRADHFYFDKTGTITEGKLSVVDAFGTHHAQSIAHTLCIQSSAHPISGAILEFVSECEVLQLKNSSYEPSRGVRGVLFNGSSVMLGSMRWFKAQNITIPHSVQDLICRWLESGLSVSLVAEGQECIGAFALYDRVSTEAQRCVDFLRSHKKKIDILSGDSSQVVKSAAVALGISEAHALGELYPEDKARIIQNEQCTTVMIGDGLNDANAMKNADVSIGVRGGIEATIEHVDIFIPRRGLEGLIDAFNASIKMRKTIWYNVLFSLGYNVIGASLAITGHVTPLVAAILMPISSLTVILFASSKRYFTGQTRNTSRWK